MHVIIPAWKLGLKPIYNHNTFVIAYLPVCGGWRQFEWNPVTLSCQTQPDISTYITCGEFPQNASENDIKNILISFLKHDFLLQIFYKIWYNFCIVIPYGNQCESLRYEKLLSVSRNISFSAY